MSNLSENKKDEYVGSVVMGGSVRGNVKIDRLVQKILCFSHSHVLLVH
jgi:hypothetical protein